MAPRKIVTKRASSIEPAKTAEKALLRRTAVARGNLIPVAPAEDLVPADLQREMMLGPDFNPNYFNTVDALIEESYGSITGKFKAISGS